MISPLPAFSRNRNLPALSSVMSNLPRHRPSVACLESVSDKVNWLRVWARTVQSIKGTTAQGDML
jgi:hypothetical protein